MPRPLDPSGTRCGCNRGVILVTSCTAAAVDRCGRCTVPVCVEHATLVDGSVLCPSCAATSTSPARRDDADDRWSEDATVRSAVDADGADESLPAATPTDPSRDDDLFTPEDYDAFDRAGDVDMNAGIDDAFDS